MQRSGVSQSPGGPGSQTGDTPFEAAYRAYLRAVKEAWSQVDIDSIPLRPTGGTPGGSQAGPTLQGFACSLFCACLTTQWPGAAAGASPPPAGAVGGSVSGGCIPCSLFCACLTVSTPDVIVSTGPTVHVSGSAGGHPGGGACFSCSLFCACLTTHWPGSTADPAVPNPVATTASSVGKAAADVPAKGTK